MRRPSIALALTLATVAAGTAAAQRTQGAPDYEEFVGHGVARELARDRARTIGGVRYDLSLDVTPLDSAVGRVTVRFDRTGTGDAILDYRGRRLTSARANGVDLPPGAFNGAHIRVDGHLLRRGENTIELSFVSEIAPSGASIIRVHDQTDESDYLYTLLVPADANQLFPCFDQPDLKARVALSLTAPRPWTVLANGSIMAADTNGDRVTTRFTRTKPLPTYLIAFAAGPWRRATSTVDGRSVSIYVRRSRFAETDTDTLLALTHRALGWMEHYFARPYPFEKFDILLAPAFPFGGMEHPGVTMFNEDRFIFRERPTLPRRLGRFSTILHEVAHQWFGDLVTMRWFDDLWLKEGFATYMAAKALADLDTTSGAWKSFYLSNKPSAYAVDQTEGTTPLWQAMANLDQAKSAYGAIVYNKAPGVLKQLNYLVGDPAFQTGVRRFLDEHAYANATWKDLLSAVGGAAHRPLGSFGKNFMLRPGMPEVEQRLLVRNGRIVSLKLIQRPVHAGVSGIGPWPMRTELLLTYADRPPVRIPVAMSSSTTDVHAARGQPAPLFVFANAADFGYFLTILDSASVRSLEQGAIATVADGFLRAMLWGTLWDQVRSARMEPSRFVRLVEARLPRESDEQLLPTLLSHLVRAMTAYTSPGTREQLRPGVERALWTAINDATRPFGVRRACLDAFVQLAATPTGTANLRAVLASDSVAGEPVRDPIRWQIVDRLVVLDAPDAGTMLATQSARDTTADGRRRAFIASAGVKTADTKRRYFTRYFADRALNEDWASGSLGAFSSLEQQELTLPFLRPALDSLPFIQTNRRIFFLGGWLGAFIGGQTSPAALDTVRTYLGNHPTLAPDLRRKVLQAVDELERTVQIRKRWP